MTMQRNGIDHMEVKFPMNITSGSYTTSKQASDIMHLATSDALTVVSSVANTVVQAIGGASMCFYGGGTAARLTHFMGILLAPDI